MIGPKRESVPGQLTLVQVRPRGVFLRPEPICAQSHLAQKRRFECLWLQHSYENARSWGKAYRLLRPNVPSFVHLGFDRGRHFPYSSTAAAKPSDLSSLCSARQQRFIGFTSEKGCTWARFACPCHPIGRSPALRALAWAATYGRPYIPCTAHCRWCAQRTLHHGPGRPNGARSAPYIMGYGSSSAWCAQRTLHAEDLDGDLALLWAVELGE